ncbi:MAG TPA: succinate dehydrogenase, partial [Candidatus Nitrosopelagicus sp.]|nr:succinate dehydrogenase [Candidatus Nitrosopelagicus sp.]
MKIHYLTAMLAVALVIVHIMVRIVQGFSDSLLFDNVVANY